MITAEEIIESLTDMADERQRDVLMRFFKTGKGEYGKPTSRWRLHNSNSQCFRMHYRNGRRPVLRRCRSGIKIRRKIKVF